MSIRRGHSKYVIAALSFVFTSAVIAQSLPQMRMTPDEIAAGANAHDNNQVGSSGLEGVHTQVLFGNPEKAGYYSILLFVPAHTTIQAHSHRDDRMATVVSGEWHFGYGDHFDPKLLKTLPPGSVYSEPGGLGHNHFAQTGDSPVIVEISGYGPTDTHYFDPANDPKSLGKKQK
ncbi:MAG TPA: cupin domain-containing protein [Candidatus Acidoferrales bacterium]|nr:cupin domain-containing protein [Candidatus Acidoferrales bacterium]